MDSSLFRAAVAGNTKVLKDGEPEKLKYLLKTTPDRGNNIVHIAAQHGHLAFIDQVLMKFPELVRQKNKGNTPLHEVALLGTKNIDKIISRILITSTGTPYLSQLNDVKDTPFHSALRTRNMAAAEALFVRVKDHPQLLLFKNKLEETPLHLYVRYCAGGIFPVKLESNDNNNAADEKLKLMDKLIIANPLALIEQDSEKMNPLMRAAQYGRVHVIHRILVGHTHLMECRDQNGMNFLHHLRLRLADLNASDKGQALWICEKILEIPGVDTLTVSCDQHGNTPLLHKAILDREFDLTQLFLRSFVVYERRGRTYVNARLKEKEELIMSIKNDEGKTVIDLIASDSDIPANLKDMLERVNKGRITSHRIALFFSVGVRNDDEAYAYSYIDKVNGCDVMHPVLHYGKKKYFEKAVERNPKVIYEKDSNGDTPLHIAARVSSDVARKVLQTTLENWRRDNKRSVCVPPWRLKNLRGDTILHEAARTCNYDTIYMLRDLCDPDAMFDINNRGETVHHLAQRYYQGNNIVIVLSKAEFMRDVDGFTPILRAAHSGNVRLVTHIHSGVSSSSIGTSDYKGRTELHHLCASVLKDDIGELESLLNKLEYESILISELMSSQDIDGNTPLHFGILNRNFEVVQCFIEHYVKKVSILEREKLFIDLKNNDGKSVWSIILEGSDIPQILKKLSNQVLTKENKLDDKIYEAASKGDTSVFDRFTDRDLFGRTSDGSNIFHIAVRNHQFSFVNTFNSGYDLGVNNFNKEDSNGDTPLHIAVRLQPSDVVFKFFKNCYSACISADILSFFGLLFMKNSRGDTVLHEAARAGNIDIISFSWTLMSHHKDWEMDDNEKSSILKSIKDSNSPFLGYTNFPLITYYIDVVNDTGETVLHIIARYATYAAKDFLHNFSQQLNSLIYKRDKEGFTPVLRAVQCGRLGMGMFLVQLDPLSVELRDDKGRTILHHLRALVMDLADDLKDILPIWKDFFEYREVDGLRSVQNEDGNTPLHSAIIDADYTKAKFLMEMCLQSNKNQELNIVNNDGHSVFDLLSTKAKLENMEKFLPLLNRRNVKERKSMNKMMDDKLYQAAVKGSVEKFDKAEADAQARARAARAEAQARAQPQERSSSASSSSRSSGRSSLTAEASEDQAQPQDQAQALEDQAQPQAQEQAQPQDQAEAPENQAQDQAEPLEDQSQPQEQAQPQDQAEAPEDQAQPQPQVEAPEDQAQPQPQPQAEDLEDQDQAEAPEDRAQPQGQAEAPEDQAQPQDQAEAPEDQAQPQVEAPEDQAQPQPQPQAEDLEDQDQAEAPEDRAQPQAQAEAPEDQAQPQDQAEAPEDRAQPQVEAPEDQAQAQPQPQAEDLEDQDQAEAPEDRAQPQAQAEAPEDQAQPQSQVCHQTT